MLTTDANVVSEGSTATFAVSSTGVEAGASVSYTISGVSEADVVGGLTGTTTVDANGDATISVELVADSLTEGAELLTVTVGTGLGADDASIAVNDTSLDVVSLELTTDVDTLFGTSGNDTFVGVAGTVADADTITDQSTSDNDTASLTVTAAYTPASIVNIENVNIDWDAFGTADVDLVNVSGATVTGTSSKLGFQGNFTVDNAGENTVVAGTGMKGALTVNGGTDITVDAGAARTVAVEGTGTADDNVSATVTAGATTTTVDVGATNGFATTNITGGAATTDITVAATSGTSDIANIIVEADVTLDVTGASSVETLNITAADGNEITLATGALLDEVTVTSDGTVTLAAEGDDLNTHTLTNATGGLTLAFTSDAANADDLSDIAFDLLDFQNALAAQVTVASGANMNADVDVNGGASTYKILGTTGTSDTATLNLSVDQTEIDVSDNSNAIETLTITTSLADADADDTLTIATLTAVNVVVSGADDVTLGNVTAASVDVSAVTGEVSITEDAGANGDDITVVGSATADNTVVFTTDAGATEYTGGNGIDDVTMAQTTGDSTVVLANGANIYSNTSLTDGTAVVIGGEGVDTITLTATDSGANTANVVIETGGGADDVTLSLAGSDETAVVNLGDGDDTLTIDNSTSAGDTLVIDGGAGTDTVELNDRDISLGDITLSNVEVLSDGGGGGIVDGSLLNGESFIIQGDGQITTRLDVTIGTAGSYDFSSLVLDATLNNGIGGLDITGSSGVDTIVGTDGSDEISGGGLADADTFVFATTHSGVTTATADIIADYVTATDILQLGTAGTAANFFELDADSTVNDDIANVELAVATANAATGAGTSFDGTVQFMFVFDSAGGVDGYLVADNNLDGAADFAIELTGLAATGGVLETDIIA